MHQGHLLSVAEVAGVAAKLKMYPYFDIANYILMCMMVREDNPSPKEDPQTFSRKHPLSCWISSMLLCFSSIVLMNAMIGESPIEPFTNHRDLLTASIVWYLINYSPLDIVYQICKFLPIKIIIYSLKEIQRVHKVHHGVHFGMHAFPDAYAIICAIGVIKGAGYYYMRTFERFVRGSWIPSNNELLHPSMATKSCLLAAILFLLEENGLIELPKNFLYLGVIVFFIFSRLLYLVFHIHDVFHPFDNVICAIFFGGLVDIFKKLLPKKEKPKVEDNHGGKGQTNKTKEE